ncbi:MAG: hypothetical protein O7G30_00965 [Proteobacteria bacterium]|nr:hypothetical protein [Pseudomonadota bacterium]
MSANSLDRGAVWKKLGAPTDQIGSVNDPRTSEEHGQRWNEKWVYLDEDSGQVERIVLWNRYDLLGVFRVNADGSVETESLAD